MMLFLTFPHCFSSFQLLKLSFFKEVINIDKRTQIMLGKLILKKYLLLMTPSDVSIFSLLRLEKKLRQTVLFFIMKSFPMQAAIPIAKFYFCMILIRLWDTTISKVVPTSHLMQESSFALSFNPTSNGVGQYSLLPIFNLCTTHNSCLERILASN